MNDNVLADRDNCTMEAVLYALFNELRAAQTAYETYIGSYKDRLDPKFQDTAARVYMAAANMQQYLHDNGYVYREVKALGVWYQCAVHPLYAAPFDRGQYDLIGGWVADRPDIPVWAVVPINMKY
jgi:hypothetical protein